MHIRSLPEETKATTLGGWSTYASHKCHAYKSKMIEKVSEVNETTKFNIFPKKYLFISTCEKKKLVFLNF